MPNTLTNIFTSTPSNLVVEAQHPSTGQWVPGTQLANGTWQIVHNLVTKTVVGAANPIITGRLQASITTTASVQASGPVLNNVLAIPTGTAATGTSTIAINVTASSNANATAYRFFASDTQTGTYVQLIQQTGASYSHAVAVGAKKWYQMQYVGGGFYDDGPISAAFLGAAILPVQVIFVGDSLEYGNDIPASSYPTQLHALLGDINYADWSNYGVNGQPVSAALAPTGSSSVNSYLDGQLATRDPTKYRMSIIVIGGSVNDYRLLGQNYPTNDAVGLTYSALRTAHQKAKAAGWKTVALTNTHYDYTVAGALNTTIRQNITDQTPYIRAYWQSDWAADAFVDLAADPNLGTVTFDSTKFEADGVHMNAAGYAIKAAIIRPAVEALAAGNGYGVVTPFPVNNGLVVNDTAPGWVYSTGWFISDASTGTVNAFIYSGGVAHTSPYQQPGTTLSAEYTLPRNAAEIIVTWPAQNVPISMNISVAGGAVRTVATAVQATNEGSSTEKTRFTGTFLAGQKIRFDNTPGASTAYAVVDQVILNTATTPAYVPPTNTALEIADTNAGITYSSGWLEVDISTTSAASIYRGGHAHYSNPNTVVSATYTLPQACSSISFYMPTTTIEYSSTISVGAGTPLVVGRLAGTTSNSTIVASLVGPFTAGQIFKVTNTAGNTTGYPLLDGFVLNQ